MVYFVSLHTTRHHLFAASCEELASLHIDTAATFGCKKHGLSKGEYAVDY